MEKDHNRRVEPGASSGLWPQRKWPNLLLLAALVTLFFHGVFLHPQRMLWGNDLVRADCTFRYAIWNSVWNWHAMPLWDPTTFCGKSMVGGAVYGLVNPFGFISWLTPNPIFLGFLVWSQVVLGAWGMFLFARKVGCDAAGAVFAAIAFALGGKTAAHIFAGHTFLVPAVLWLPWVLWAVERTTEDRRLFSACLLGLTMAAAASFSTTHVLYMNGLFATSYAVVRLVQVWRKEGLTAARRQSGLYVFGALIFLGASAAWWLPVVRQTLLLSARAQMPDIGAATMASAGLDDLLRLVWPFSGIPTPRPFASDAEHQFFWETASYPGVVTLVLALICLVFVWREPMILMWACFGYVALMLVFGDLSPLFWAAYYGLPGFKLFRGWGRLFFYVNFVMAILAGRFLSKTADAKLRWSVFLAVLGLTFAVFLATLAMTGSWVAPPRGQWTPLLVLLALTLVVFFRASRQFSEGVWRGGCIALLAGELFLFWQPHIQTVEPRRVLPSLAAAKFLGKEHEQDEFRVLDLTGMLQQQLAIRDGLEIIDGYDPAVSARFLEVYRRIWANDRSDAVEVLTHPPREIVCPAILDMMNAKYLVAFEPDLGKDYQMLYRTPDYESAQPRYVHLRKTALPRAFLVASAELPPKGVSVPEALCAIDPHKTCLVEDRPEQGTAEFQALPLERRSPSDITLRFASAGPGVAVISQAWHPDWRAIDNGLAVEVRRVNHDFVGVPVSAGEHELRIWYRPWDFCLGCVLSGVSAIGIVVVGLWQRLGRMAPKTAD